MSEGHEGANFSNETIPASPKGFGEARRFSRVEISKSTAGRVARLPCTVAANEPSKLAPNLSGAVGFFFFLLIFRLRRRLAFAIWCRRTEKFAFAKTGLVLDENSNFS